MLCFFISTKLWSKKYATDNSCFSFQHTIAKGDKDDTLKPSVSNVILCAYSYVGIPNHYFISQMTFVRVDNVPAFSKYVHKFAFLFTLDVF